MLAVTVAASTRSEDCAVRVPGKSVVFLTSICTGVQKKRKGAPLNETLVGMMCSILSNESWTKPRTDAKRLIVVSPETAEAQMCGKCAIRMPD